MQRERVQDQYPWTWEFPLVVICAVLLLGVTVCQLGRSIGELVRRRRVVVADLRQVGDQRPRRVSR